METEQVYERLAEPAARLERWVVKRRRGVSLAELRSMAWSMIESFEEIVAIEEPIRLSITVRQVADAEEVNNDETEAEAEEQAFLAGLNTTLETLRRCRSLFTGQTSSLLRDALAVRDPALLETYDSTLAQAMDRLVEIEKTLVMFGGGTDADDDLVADVVPQLSESPPAGPSVAFEL